MSDDTWNEDTIQPDKSGAASAPAGSASTGGIGNDDAGGHAGTRTGDPRSGGTSDTTSGDAPYDLDAGGSGGSDAQSPSGT